MWRDKIKLNPGETLRFDRSHSKGSLGQEDINIYSVLNQDGIVVGTLEHRDHTSIRGFSRTESLIQKDNTGKLIVDEHWSER